MTKLTKRHSLRDAWTVTPTLQIRLDQKSQRTLDRLVKHLGWSRSKVVQESVRLLAACRLPRSSQRVIGMGEFDSGIGDLGSNKAHLQHFGQKFRSEAVPES